MTAFKQTEEGDFAVSKGALKLTDGKIETMQLLRSRLRVFQGEWFLDTTAGTPYFQKVLGKDKNPRMAEAVIKDVIVTTPGVLELLEFSFQVDKGTRHCNVVFVVRSASGIIELSEVI